MAEIVIAAAYRDEFGKGAARRLRRDKMIPAVMYGHGSDPVHIALPSHVTTLALRTANVLLTIDLPKRENEKTKPPAQLALARQIQRDPVRDAIEHLDLIIVKRGEKVTVEVPLVVSGEIVGEGVLIQDQNTITLEVEATAIPANIEISVEGLEAGTTITAKDVRLPSGAVFNGDPDALILSIQLPQAEDLGEAVAEEEETETDEAAEE